MSILDFPKLIKDAMPDKRIKSIEIMMDSNEVKIHLFDWQTFSIHVDECELCGGYVISGEGPCEECVSKYS